MKSLKRFILVGAPASGKGTQGRFLSEHFHLKSLSTGAMLRREIENCSEIGLRAQSYMNKAMLVPDEVVNDMVRGWIHGAEDEGWLLDGYPRTVAQAETLDHFLAERGLAVDIVVWLDVSRKLIENRISLRRECPVCGLVVQGKIDDCPKCGAGMVARSDDNLEAFARRWKDFEALTLPVARYYESRGMVVKMSVEEEREPEDVSRDLLARIEDYAKS